MTNTMLGFLPQRLFAPEGATTPAPDPATQTPAGLTDEPVFEDEEVAIPDEDDDGAPADPAAETPAVPPATPPKKRGPKRYAALTRERDDARSYAEQVARENAELRRIATEANTKAAESAEVAMQTYEAKAKSDLAAAKKAHTEALSSNDASQITEASEALSSARSAMDDIEAYKKQKPAAAPAQQPQQQAPQQRQQPQQQPEPDMPPEVVGWLENNRWFDAVERDSSGRPLLNQTTGQLHGNPEFQKDMHAEATLFAGKIERQIARGQVNFKIMSPEYFAAVEEHMREEFPDYFGDDDDDATPPPAPTKRGSPVAAPGNRNLPGAAPKNNGKSYKLSADEVRFITKQVQNGGGAKYPKGHTKQFTPMSLEDAKISFARQKLKQAKEQ